MSMQVPVAHDYLNTYYGSVDPFVLSMLSPHQRTHIERKQKSGSYFFCWFQVPYLNPGSVPTQVLFGVSESFADDDDEMEMEKYIFNGNSSIKLVEYTRLLSVEEATKAIEKISPDPDRSDITISKEEMLKELFWTIIVLHICKMDSLLMAYKVFEP